MKSARSMKTPPHKPVPLTLLSSCLLLGAALPDIGYSNEADVKLKNGGLRISYGESSLRIGGRAQFDALYADDDVTNIDSGTDVRRARVFVSGKINPKWKYKFQYDFSEETAKDMYIAYNMDSGSQITLGHFAPAMFLESFTSSKWTTFIERAVVDNFALDRELGVQYKRTGTHYSTSLSVTGDNMEYDEGGDDAYSLVGRLTLSPKHETGNVLHFGITAALMEASDGVSAGARPNSKVDGGTKLIKASLNDATSSTVFGLEAATVCGAFSAQAEFVSVTAEGDDTVEDETYSAYYAAASYFFTGESRSYYVDGGAFDSPSAMNGAVEAAIRFDHIDLNDDENGLTDDQGEMDMITLGLNYYPNSSVRFSLNYVNADVERAPSAGGEDESVNLMQLRTQLVF